MDAADGGPRSEEGMAGLLDEALRRVPARLRAPIVRILSSWPGRILIRAAIGCLRVEIFDRAMTIAAQFFTSVVPILILAATWASASDADVLSDLVAVPEESRSVIDEATQGADSAAFGIVGTVLVLASATSLSRAMTRTFAVIWRVPRPRSGLRSAWRWLAVVMVLAAAVVFSNSLSERTSLLPPRSVWPVALSFATDVAVAVFVPWVLLSGRVAARLLVPGAAICALLMLAVRPVSELWLPRALEVSAERYGSIGLAFTYLAWLYVVAFVFVATAVLGQVIASDAGRLGGWIRGEHPYRD
jgi:membrane protein